VNEGVKVERLKTVSTQLKIQLMEYSAPCLTISGAGWNFSTLNPWRVLKNGQICFTSDVENAADEIGGLASLDIRSIEVLKIDGVNDLIIRFSDGAAMHVTSMGEGEEWVLNLSDNFTWVEVR